MVLERVHPLAEEVRARCLAPRPSQVRRVELSRSVEELRPPQVRIRTVVCHRPQDRHTVHFADTADQRVVVVPPQAGRQSPEVRGLDHVRVELGGLDFARRKEHLDRAVALAYALPHVDPHAARLADLDHVSRENVRLLVGGVVNPNRPLSRGHKLIEIPVPIEQPDGVTDVRPLRSEPCGIKDRHTSLRAEVPLVLLLPAPARERRFFGRDNLRRERDGVRLVAKVHGNEARAGRACGYPAHYYGWRFNSHCPTLPKPMRHDHRSSRTARSLCSWSGLRSSSSSQNIDYYNSSSARADQAPVQETAERFARHTGIESQRSFA